MKKRYLLLVFAFILTLGLVSCSTSNEKKGKSGGVLDAEFIKDNISESDTTEEVVDYSDISFASNQFDSESIVNSSYYSNGLLVVKNSNSRVGFYSMQYDKYIVNPRFVEEWVNYYVITSSYMDYVLVIDYNCQTFVYDSLGNELYNGDECYNVTVSYEQVNGKLYCTLRTYEDYYSSNYDYFYFVYEDNGSAKEVDYIDYDYDDDDDNADNETEYPYGSYYREVNDLSEYGLNYYFSLYNNLLTIYDSDKNYVFTTHIPNEVNNLTFVSDKIYYQITTLLPEDSDNYDYSSGSNKYGLSTYSISLKDGVHKEVDLNYIINSSRPFNKKTSTENYSILNVQMINDNKTLGFVEDYIVDSDGNLRDNVTDMELDSFVVVGDGLYNTRTKIMYNSNLEVVAYFNDIDPVFYEKEGYFVGAVDGLYGIIDTNGKVVCEFEYDRISSTFVDDCIIGQKNGSYYRIDLKNNNHTRLGYIEDTTIVNPYLYIIDNSSYINFEGVNKRLDSYDCLYYYNNFTYQISSSLYSAGNISVKIKGQDYYDDSIYIEQCYYFKFNDYPNEASFTSHGTEDNSDVVLGSSFDDAIELSLDGDNYYYYLTNQNGTIFEYTPQETAYYTIESDNVSFGLYDEDGNSVSINSSGYLYTALLEEGKTYYYRAYSTSSYSNKTCFKFDFTKEKGFRSNYPVIYNDKITVTFDNEDYFYVSYTPLYDGYHDISFTQNFDLDVIDPSGNDIYSSGSRLFLYEGQEYLFRYEYDSYSYYYTGVFETTISYSNNQPEGLTITTANAISAGSYEHFNDYGDDYNYYYSYTNNTNRPQLVNMNLQNVNTSGYVSYSTYNNDKLLLEENTVNSSLTSSVNLVLNGQTIYYKVDMPISYSATLYLDAIEYEGSIETIATTELNSATGFNIYQLDYNYDDCNYRSISFSALNSADGEFYVYDKNFKPIVNVSGIYSFERNYIGVVYIVVGASEAIEFIVNEENHDNLIFIENNSSTPFSATYSSNINGPHAFTSQNKSHSSSSSVVITALYDCTIEFEYLVSSEANYDYFRVILDGNTINSYSGTSQGDVYSDYSITLSAGQILTLRYSKDGSSSSGDDCVYIRNLTATIA